MARKLRLEFPGAIYHVINRGNYRKWVFEEERTKAAFEGCLFEACERSEWLMHAFVVMGNHYHLALETPKGNLVAGMQWLQSSFANRFNKYRGEQGHLFQGRYKSLLVEAGGALGQLCHYQHLNPVRAGIVPASRLKDFRYSSYWYLNEPKRRPKFLRPETALWEAGELVDSSKGRKLYEGYLEWQAEEGPAGKNKAYVSMSKGWALGTGEFKEALLKDHGIAAEARAWESTGVKELKALKWKYLLKVALAHTPDQKDKRKSAPWKIAVAAHLKGSSEVANAWLAEALDMGSGHYLSKHVGLFHRQPRHPARQHFDRLRKVRSTA